MLPFDNTPVVLAELIVSELTPQAFLETGWLSVLLADLIVSELTAQASLETEWLPELSSASSSAGPSPLGIPTFF